MRTIAILPDNAAKLLPSALNVKEGKFSIAGETVGVTEGCGGSRKAEVGWSPCELETGTAL